jgi:hypothetical protein
LEADHLTLWFGGGRITAGHNLEPRQFGFRANVRHR